MHENTLLNKQTKKRCTSSRWELKSVFTRWSPAQAVWSHNITNSDIRMWNLRLWKLRHARSYSHPMFSSILHARKSSPLYMIYAELGRYPIELHVKGRMVNFWKRLISGKQTKIAFILYQKLRNTPDINSKWIRKLQQIFQDCGRPDIWQNQIPHSNICPIIKQNLKDQFQQCWGSK